VSGPLPRPPLPVPHPAVWGDPGAGGGLHDGTHFGPSVARASAAPFPPGSGDMLTRAHPWRYGAARWSSPRGCEILPPCARRSYAAAVSARQSLSSVADRVAASDTRRRSPRRGAFCVHCCHGECARPVDLMSVQSFSMTTSSGTNISLPEFVSGRRFRSTSRSALIQPL
jgi:hypothetical protein